MFVTIFYLLAIVGVNIIFAQAPPLETSMGFLPPGTFVVGVVFVLRDYVQRKIGHNVLFIMLLGCTISFFMASPMVATASLTAFVFAELMDWAIYSLLPTTFDKKVLFSSMAGVLTDTLIFLPMVGLFSWGAVLIMWLSKMVAAILVYMYHSKQVLGAK